MVRIKLNPIESVIKGKKIVLVDDSIVRGTTLQRLVSLVRETGAKEIHLRISSPPFIRPCYYGTDVDSCDKLIACRHNNMEDIAKELGADSVGYLSIEHAKQLATEKGLSFCTACFDGIYPIEPPKPINPDDIQLDRKLSDTPKKKED
jgi:amidophosphoribosyltransferase